MTYIWSNRKGRVARDQQAIDWILEMRKATSRCVLLGTSLSGWLKDPTFAEAVKGMASKVRFQILMLDPDSKAADIRQEEEREFQEQTKRRIAGSFLELVALRDSLPQESQENFRLYFYSAMPTFSCCWVDGYMIVTHYLPGLPNRYCPAYGLWNLHPFRPETEAQLYHVFSDNVEFLLRRAVEVTPKNLDARMAAARVHTEHVEG